MKNPITFILSLISIFSTVDSYAQSVILNQAPSLYIGILETEIEYNANNRLAKNEMIPKERKARVLFVKQANQWLSLEDKIENAALYPEKSSWTIAFDGKNIGGFSSVSNATQLDKRLRGSPRKVHHKPSTQQLPTIGEPSPLFQSWEHPSNYRPLVLVSKPNYTDPERWKPFAPEPELKTLVYTIYKSYQEAGLQSEKIAFDSIVFLKSYQSNKNDRLLHVAYKKTDYENKVYITNKTWFFASRHGEIINLSKVIDYRHQDRGDASISECALIDAGDYDGDGQSEVLFWVNRYNGNGYILFYNDFTAHAAFEWSYH